MNTLRKISIASPADLGLVSGSKPVRTPNRRNYGRATDGDGGDHKALGQAPFRSLLERDARTLLNANPEIKSYAIEPHTLKYFIPNDSGGHDPHEYVADIVLCDHRVSLAVVDAKAKYFTTTAYWSKCEPYITEAYNLDHGVPFVVLSEDTIRLQPRLANCEILKRHRYIVDDIAAIMRVRDVIDVVGLPTTIGEVVSAARLNSMQGSCRSYTAIMNLALRGEVDLDLSKPFSLTTHIRKRGS
jgi:hypothetical protein